MNRAGPSSPRNERIIVERASAIKIAARIIAKKTAHFFTVAISIPIIWLPGI
jgi:hypothetical protein